jgi:hypothetical protein
MKEQRTHSIPLKKLAELMFEFLTRQLGRPEEITAQAIWQDYTHGGRQDRPAFLQRFELPPAHTLHSRSSLIPLRQARHAQT